MLLFLKVVGKMDYKRLPVTSDNSPNLIPFLINLDSLLNDISTFMGYLMPKPSLEKKSSDAI